MPTGWHSRGYLPHFAGGPVPQMVTFRLAGSVAVEFLARLEEELRLFGPAEKKRRRHRHIEEYLDTGVGPRWLQEPPVAEMVEQALLHFDGERYALLSWVIMSNHVHALLVPEPPHELDNILHSWRSYTAHQANRLLHRTGHFWDHDYFDRFIRNQEHLAAAMNYIEMNPVKLRLCREPAEWPYGSARRR